MRLFALLFFVSMLSACASIADRHTPQDIDDSIIDAHQQSLAGINAWEFQSRMAFFDHQDNSRQSASLRWQNEASQRSLRISHPLRGTLARVEETADYAKLTDHQGEEFFAADIESLLLIHLNVFLPIELIHDALLGRLPQTQIINPHYYADGTLASYQVDIDNAQGFMSQDNISQTSWQVSLARYQQASDYAVQLPHQLELSSDDYLIRLSISRWSITPPENGLGSQDRVE
ncbi:MAG: outer membrane lipoprotein LolB [Idiomarina sp.]|nr:outer membrane lipoprotein LolB [Idiomarina sp.]